MDKNLFKPGDRKRLGMPLSGHNSTEEITADSKVEIIQPGKTPILTQENGNLSVMLAQLWVTKTAAIEIFSDNEYRRGFVITNNGIATIYIGTSDDAALLKKMGTPVYVKASFSSGLYQGKLWVVADDAAAGSVDVRVWEEQI